MGKFKNKYDEFDYKGLMSYLLKSVETKWRRVVFGIDILINNCCDPDLDYLEFEPGIRAFVEGRAREESHMQSKMRAAQKAYWSNERSMVNLKIMEDLERQVDAILETENKTPDLFDQAKKE